MMDYIPKEFAVCTNREIGFIFPKTITKIILWKAVTNGDHNLPPNGYKKDEPYIHSNFWGTDKVMCCPPIVKSSGMK